AQVSTLMNCQCLLISPLPDISSAADFDAEMMFDQSDFGTLLDVLLPVDDGVRSEPMASHEEHTAANRSTREVDTTTGSKYGMRDSGANADVSPTMEGERSAESKSFRDK